MPVTFVDLPPDHPIFHRGVSFVLRSDPPEEEQDESEPGDEDAED